jgi:hypothetical protein
MTKNEIIEFNTKYPVGSIITINHKGTGYQRCKIKEPAFLEKRKGYIIFERVHIGRYTKQLRMEESYHTIIALGHKTNLKDFTIHENIQDDRISYIN